MYKSKSEFIKQLNKEIEELCKDYYNEFEKAYDVLKDQRDEIIDKIKYSIYKLVSIYELKYPEHIIDILMQDVESKPTNSNIINAERLYFGNTFGEKQQDIDWINIMNIEDVMPSLDDYQRLFLKAPYSYTYQYFYPKDKSNLQFKLKLSDDGRVESLEISRFYNYQDSPNIDSKILEIASNANGKTLKDVLAELRKVGISGFDEYEKIADYLEKWTIYRNRYLNLVMKQILITGGCRIGGKRAFLFALENKLDISFPLKYGLDSSDPYERYFINEYLKEDGDPDLVCHINFMNGLETYTETLRKRLKYRNTLGKISYTNEEKQLHSRLVLALTMHPNYKKQ